jgi:hypothetical protein
LDDVLQKVMAVDKVAQTRSHFDDGLNAGEGRDKGDGHRPEYNERNGDTPHNNVADHPLLAADMNVLP